MNLKINKAVYFFIFSVYYTKGLYDTRFDKNVNIECHK